MRRFVLRLLENADPLTLLFYLPACSCTFHLVHLLVCWWYNATFPTNASWWLVNAVCAAIMCVSGEFLCLRTELQEIPVGYAALNTKADL